MLFRSCAARGVQALTVFAFSSENWRRPPDEVSGLMGLMGKSLASEVPALQEAGVRLRFIGQLNALAEGLQAALAQAEAQTASGQRMTLNVCLNYGGRWDIVQAAARLAARGETITEEALGQALSLACSPDPDLLIRTGGEQRISNFLLLADLRRHAGTWAWTCVITLVAGACVSGQLRILHGALDSAAKTTGVTPQGVPRSTDMLHAARLMSGFIIALVVLAAAAVLAH